MDTLPIDSLLPRILAALAMHRSCVIQAPPGAGKTTRVPLALLDADWLAGRKLVMLEPRRLAARAAAHFMAKLLGEQVGETVGYRVRMDTRVGPRTRIEVVTEGVLTRLLQSDAALTDYGGVIFDEFHERSLHADLALALCLEARQALRPELRIAVMSATLDGAPVANLLGEAPLLTSEGRSFPVDTYYRALSPRDPMEPQVANAIRRVLAEETGSVLVFLPGGGEIRRVMGLLQAGLPPQTQLMPLYGDLSQEQQQAAILPAAPGHRKLVLATAIAETSLTIEGVRVVVDAGRTRVPRFDPVSGLTRLVTVRVSRASADQRRGRAGRLEPGVCFRLWSEGERLEAQRPAEILQADLAPLALELARWGVGDATRLAWLDAPPAAALAQARELLCELDALDMQNRITEHGRRLLDLPLHPRLAHMVAKSGQQAWLACVLAALVSERDVLPSSEPQADIGLRISMLNARTANPQLRRVRATAADIAHQAGVHVEHRIAAEHSGRLLALAYPDRVAKRRAGHAPRYLLSNGRGAFLPANDALGAAGWLATVALDGEAREARIYLAAPLAEADVHAVFADKIVRHEVIRWDDTADAVTATLEQRLGAIVLEQQPIPSPDRDRVIGVMLETIRRRGLDCLPWTPALRQWQARLMLLRHLDGNSWPAVDDEILLATLENWLAPLLRHHLRPGRLGDLPLQQAFGGMLEYRQQRRLEELAPTHFTVPTGSRIPIDYTAGEVPVLAVRVQELFGLHTTPAIVGGRVPLLLHLLSPAGRPLQVTRDLAGFWKSSYQDVKKDMKGRYPKHPWPDDPLQAEPTRRALRRS